MFVSQRNKQGMFKCLVSRSKLRMLKFLASRTMFGVFKCLVPRYIFLILLIYRFHL